MKIGLKIMKIVLVSSLVFPTIFFSACGGGGGGDGGGDGSPPSISYTGNTTQATIDENNAQVLSTGAYQNSQRGSSPGKLIAAEPEEVRHIGLPLMLEVAQALEDSMSPVDLMSRSGGTYLRAIYTVSDTVYGSCGGSGSYSISIDDINGEFWGSYNYSDYCNFGFTISGDINFSGAYDFNTGSFLRFSFSFSNLTGTSESDSFTLEGNISWDFTGYPTTLTMTVLIKDNGTGKVYWVKDFIMTITEGLYSIEFEMSGYFYDPDFGYIIISTEVPFVIYYGYSWPSDGVLVITGDTGIGGGSTKARLTILSSTTYRVEADTDGDGSYDWDSGVLYW